MIKLTLHKDDRSFEIDYKIDSKEDSLKFVTVCRAFGTQSYEGRGLLPLSSALDFTRALREKGFKVSVDTTVKCCFYAEMGMHPETIHAIKDSTLFPYQKEDAIWLASKEKALLANEMGTGKTPTTLMALPPSHAARVIVVCPASIKSVWSDECEKWRPDFKIKIASGRNGFVLPDDGEMVIVNYEVLPKIEGDIFANDGENTAPIQIIADECHYLKNGKANRTKNFRLLSRAVLKNHGSVWLLSGTPMMNNPLELWNVLMAAKLELDTFDSWPTFVRLFHGMKNEWNAWKWGNPDPSVADRIRHVMARRTRREVLPDLPTKFYRKTVVLIDKKTKALCDGIVKTTSELDIALEDAIDRVARNRDARIGFEEMAEARRQLATAKIPYMLSLVETFEEADEPVVVFSAHTAPIDVLENRKGWAVITGSTGEDKRADAVRRFQDGKLKGIAATIKAGGVGLTLTHAHQAIFVDMDWTPAMNLQAEDRLCRIGQTKGVIINRIIADHVLDDRLTSILVSKKKLLEATDLI
jgi:SWI/SNF-related matrix-associated actin-dependent regulator of chromatin subfamily A-like protein 1